MATIHLADPGQHNADLNATIARLTREGCWKNQRVVWIIPHGASIPGKVYCAHRSVIFPPNQAVVPLGVEGAEVGHAYEAALDVILQSNLRDFEYALTVEHDNIPQSDGALKLMAHMDAHPEFAAISGLYFTKGPGGVAQIWGDVSDPVPNYRPQVPKVGELVECYGIGQGFALWRISMFRELEAKKVPRPWFKTCADATGSGTQDLYAWGNVFRPNGYRCAVACDVPVGHYDSSTGICW